MDDPGDDHHCQRADRHETILEKERRDQPEESGVEDENVGVLEQFPIHAVRALLRFIIVLA